MTHGLTIEQFVRSWRPVSRRAVDAAHSYKQNMRSHTQTDKHTQTKARGRLCVCVRKMVNRAAITTKPLLTSTSQSSSLLLHMFGVCPFGASTFSSIYTSDCSRGCMRVSVCVYVYVCNTLQNVTQLKKFWRGSCRFSHTYTPRKSHTQMQDLLYKG